MKQQNSVSTNNNNNNSMLDYQLVVPQATDFPQLARMQMLAFAEKRSCCCFPSDSATQAKIVKTYETYAKHYPQKIQHCRIVVWRGQAEEQQAHDDDSSPRTILGACQLQLPGDPGDGNMEEWMRHKLLPREAHVEWIATHPDYTGKGIGSALLQWAFETCQQQVQQIDRLSLEVMTANQGAYRLYERKGFVAQAHDPHVQDACEEYVCTPLVVFCCLGCRYCSVVYMEKPIVSVPSPDDGPVVAEQGAQTMERS